MDRRNSENSIGASLNSGTGFITPQGSISGRAGHAGYDPEHAAPAYSENPYLANQTSAVNDPNYIHNNFNEDREAAGAAGRHSMASHRQSIGGASTTPSRRGFTSSIRSYFHRNSSTHSHRGSHADENGEETKEDGENGEKEHNQEKPEDVEKKMEDPQYLLNTILEEPEEDQAFVPGDAAAAMAIAAPSEYESSIQQQRRQGYRENLMRHRKLRRFTKASWTISKLRAGYQKMIHWSLVTRLFVYWFPLALILFIPLAVGAWKNPDMAVGGTRIMWIFIWLEVCWGSLWMGRIFAHYMPEIVGFVLSVFLPRYFRYVDMFLSLELSVQLLIWTFVTFISFSPLLTANSDALDKDEYHKQPHWQKIVQDICVALLVSAIVFFVEQVFMYLLSTSFHRTRMSLRIEMQKKSVHVLIILLSMAYSFFPYQCDEFAEEDENLRYATLKRASKKMGNVKTGNKILTKVKNTASKAAKDVSNLVADAAAAGSSSQPSVAKIVKNALTNRETREILACRIWKSLVMEDSNALQYEDLLGVFGKDRKEEVLFMFDILDSDGQDGIDLDEMIESVNRIGREAKQISKSLVDLNGAITKLHYLLMCIALVLIVVIFVGMLAPSSATVLATLGSTLLSMSFLFSATAQEVFQSCVFLFVKHPFDVGDWIQTAVPGLTGLVRMQVAELNLMYSVFNQIGVNTRRQVSNSVLNAQFIDNISRSPPSQVSIILTIGVPETTPEQLAEFEQRMIEFVEAHPREFAPGVFFQVIDHPDLDRMSLNICVNTRNNQDDIVLFSNRRTLALEFIGQCIHEIPITIPQREDTSFHDPSMPMFQYNITDVEEAMKYSEKIKNRRKPMGMRARVDEDDESKIVGEAPVSESTHPGYVDIPASTTHRPDASLRRQQSISSRASRGFSTASRQSQAFGLRSRGQQRGDTNISTN